MMMADKKYIVAYTPPLFLAYMQPNGFLDQHRESHGLFYYNLIARNAYEKHVSDSLKLEGELEVQPEFRKIFESVANLYGVKPHEMAKCWDMVDMQCQILDIPTLPDEERYRFNTPDKITLQ